jgi:hypothetical protein
MAILGTSGVNDAEKRIISLCDLLRDDFDQSLNNIPRNFHKSGLSDGV